MEVNCDYYNTIITVTVNGGWGGGSRSEIEATGQEQSQLVCVQGGRWSFSLLKTLSIPQMG